MCAIKGKLTMIYAYSSPVAFRWEEFVSHAKPYIVTFLGGLQLFDCHETPVDTVDVQISSKFSKTGCILANVPRCNQQVNMFPCQVLEFFHGVQDHSFTSSWCEMIRSKNSASAVSKLGRGVLKGQVKENI
tara:strand:+ start:2824 stop:3216 length:393 start_codon:yes stop_codon:yes gene_type:complete